jgi:hypothetical protein
MGTHTFFQPVKLLLTSQATFNRQAAFSQAAFSQAAFFVRMNAARPIDHTTRVSYYKKSGSLTAATFSF